MYQRKVNRIPMTTYDLKDLSLELAFMCGEFNAVDQQAQHNGIHRHTMTAALRDIDLLSRMQAYTSHSHVNPASRRYKAYIKRARYHMTRPHDSKTLHWAILMTFPIPEDTTLQRLLLDRFNRPDVTKVAIKSNTLLPELWIRELTFATFNTLRPRVHSEHSVIRFTLIVDKSTRKHDEELTHSSCCLSVEQVDNQHFGFGVAIDKPYTDPITHEISEIAPLYALKFKKPDSPTGFRHNRHNYTLPKYFVHSYDSETANETGQLQRKLSKFNQPASTQTINKIFTYDSYHCQDWDDIYVPKGFSFDVEDIEPQDTLSRPHQSPFNHYSLDTLDTAIACLAYRVVAVIFTQDLTGENVEQLSKILDKINLANGIAILVTSYDPIPEFCPPRRYR